MNYFELFEIPVRLNINAGNLKKKFYELSRKYHPDFHSTSGEGEKDDALEKSSMLNRAWKTFQSPDETIKYFLKLKGLLEEEEKYELPPAFLMEMLEINEQVMDAKMEGDHEAIEKVKSAILQIENEIYEPVEQIIEGYQEHSTTKEELLQVKAYYYKKKYLNRILEGLQ